MSTLELYRRYVLAHADVDDDVVLAELELAAQEHTASQWGAVYAQAMVWYAAHNIETTPGTGAGSDDASVAGPVVSQRDGDLSRTYAQPSSSSSGSASDDDLRRTVYGQRYLRLRGKRASTGPMVVR